MTQANVLNNLIELHPELSEEQRGHILSRIEGLQHSDRSVTRTINRMAVVYRADRARIGQPTSIIEATRQSRTVASNADVDQIMLDEWKQVSRRDTSFTPLYTRGMLAHLNDVRFSTASKQAVRVFTAEPDQPVS